MPAPVLDYHRPIRASRSFPWQGIEISLATLCFLLFIGFAFQAFTPSGRGRLTVEYLRYLLTQRDRQRRDE